MTLNFHASNKNTYQAVIKHICRFNYDQDTYGNSSVYDERIAGDASWIPEAIDENSFFLPSGWDTEEKIQLLKEGFNPRETYDSTSLRFYQPARHKYANICPKADHVTNKQTITDFDNYPFNLIEFCIFAL